MAKSKPNKRAHLKKKSLAGRKSKKSGSRSKDIINEEIFGANLKNSDPNDGISHIKIELDDLGNIPGLSKHWFKDLEHRRKEILEWKNQNFFQRAANLIRNGSSLSPQVTGEELSKHHPTKAADRLVEQLKKNPLDLQSRVELVSLVSKSGRSFPLEVYRALMMQAVVTCTLGELNTSALKMALWCQEAYFNKFAYKCSEQLSMLEIKLEQYTKSNPYFQATIDQSSLVRRSMDLAKACQKQVSKSIRDSTSAFPATLTIKELTNYTIEEKKPHSEKKVSLFKRITELSMIMRYIILLHPTAFEYLNLLAKAEGDHPLPQFLLARVSMSNLVFNVNQYLAGNRTAAHTKEIQEAFKKTYHHYGLAVSKIGTVARNKTEYTILIEYANLVHYFYKVTINILGVRPPKIWLHTAFAKALKALAMAQDSDKVGDLMARIQLDMEQEGLD